MKNNNIVRGEKITALLLSMFFLLFYIYFQTQSIYGGDGGDLVTAAYMQGVAHPPGYPLYTIIGWLLTKIPLFTVAWRVGLLSSIPAAFSLGIIYLISNRIIKQRLVSIVSVATLGFSYLYWLYSIVPEVFMLNIFLAVTGLWLMIRFEETAEKIYLAGLYLIFGLSLSHHHTILLILPTLIYFGWTIKNRKAVKRLMSLKFIPLITLGLLPYLYIYLVSIYHPSIFNWENTTTLSGFFDLISRQAYGSFAANRNFIPPTAFGRYYQIYNFFDTSILDFTKLGIILFVCGASGLFLKNKRWFWILMLGLIISGPAFMFYAGFPFVLNFHLGTVERFFLLPYIFITPIIGYGILISAKLINLAINKLIKKNVTPAVLLIFCIYPLTIFLTNYPKIAPLKTDMTAEDLAADILASAPDNSVILLFGDSEVFNTQYFYFSLGGKIAFRNIKLIHTGLLGKQFYQQNLPHLYPDLIVPQSQDTSKAVAELVKNNFSRFPILATGKFDIDKDYVWIPRGLLFEMHQQSETSDTNTFIKTNEVLFSGFSDPLSGALQSYNHPMLADIRRIYANSYHEMGQALFILGNYDRAEIYYQKAVVLEPYTAANIEGLIWSQLMIQKCSNVQKNIEELESRFKNNSELNKLKALYYKKCEKNDIKSEEYRQKYIEQNSFNKTNLKDF